MQVGDKVQLDGREFAVVHEFRNGDVLASPTAAIEQTLRASEREYLSRAVRLELKINIETLEDVYEPHPRALL
jgi:hypothetical protein